jgi:hypothetical protein
MSPHTELRMHPDRLAVPSYAQLLLNSPRRRIYTIWNAAALSDKQSLEVLMLCSPSTGNVDKACRAVFEVLQALGEHAGKLSADDIGSF